MAVIRAIHIYLTTTVMDDLAYFCYFFFEHSMR